MQKRSRRKASEIEKLRSKILKIIKREGRISLTSLVRHYGSSIGIRNTPSDKNLAKRQLDLLAKSNQISFRRDGRNLIAQDAFGGGGDSGELDDSYDFDAAEAPPVLMGSAPEQQEVSQAAPAPVATAAAESLDISNADLDVIKAYAHQVEEFSKTLYMQVSTLVRMVEKAQRTSKG